MLIEILKPDFVFEDERGKLIQLVHGGYSQFNIVLSKSGMLRGKHYHKENNEVFFVIDGSFEFIASRENEIENYVFRKGDMFLVRPYVIHSFKYLEDSLVAAMYDKGVEHEDSTKDIYTE